MGTLNGQTFKGVTTQLHSSSTQRSKDVTAIVLEEQRGSKQTIQPTEPPSNGSHQVYISELLNASSLSSI